MPNQIKKHRIEAFDLLKGMAIFLVVMGHVLTMCVRGLDASFLFKFIAQVHMPVFFFISGYFTYKVTENDGFAAPNLKKRFMQLVVPLLVVPTLWVLYFPHSGLQSPLHSDLPGLWSAYWKDGYWFTLCLFELCLLYWPLSRLLSKLKGWGTQLLVQLLTYAVFIALAVAFANEEQNVDYVGFGLLARFFPIFMMGLYAHRFKQAFSHVLHSSRCLTVALVVFALTFYVVAYRYDMPWRDSEAICQAVNYVLLPVMQFSLLVVAIAAVEPWSQRQFHTEGHRPCAVARWFNLLGHESLGIYLLHYFFLFPLTMLQEPLKAMNMDLVPLALVAVPVALCVVSVTLLVVYLLKRSPLLGLLFTGTLKSAS